MAERHAPLESPGASRRRSRQVLIGAAAMMAARLVNLLSSFVIIGILTRQLDRERFGLWAVVGTLVFFAGNFDFGLGQELKNRLAAMAARSETRSDEHREAADLFFATLTFLAGFVALLAVVVVAVGPWLPWAAWLGVTDSALAERTPLLIVSVACLLLLNLPLTLGTSGFLAYQEAHLRSLLDALQAIALTVTVFALASRLPIDDFIVLYYVVFDVVALVALVAFLKRRAWRVPRLSARTILARVRGLVVPSLNFWVLGFAAMLIFSTDPVIAARVLGIAQAGDFSVVQKMFTFLIGLHFTVLTPLWSAYTHAAALDDWAWIRRALGRSLLVTFGLFVVGGAALVVLHPALLKVWTGRAIVDAPLIVAMVAWAGVYGLINCLSVLLNGLGNIKEQLALIVFAAVVHWPLSTALGERFGAVGIVVGTVVSILPLALGNTKVVYDLLRRRT